LVSLRWAEMNRRVERRSGNGRAPPLSRGLVNVDRPVAELEVAMRRGSHRSHGGDSRTVASATWAPAGFGTGSDRE
jgi:hypothetical protein